VLKRIGYDLLGRWISVVARERERPDDRTPSAQHFRNYCICICIVNYCIPLIILLLLYCWYGSTPYVARIPLICWAHELTLMIYESSVGHVVD